MFEHLDNGDLLAVLVAVGVALLHDARRRGQILLFLPPRPIHDGTEKGKDEQKRDHDKPDDGELGAEEPAHDEAERTHFLIGSLFFPRFRRFGNYCFNGLGNFRFDGFRFGDIRFDGFRLVLFGGGMEFFV